MQFDRNDSIKKNLPLSLAAATLFAGLAAFAFTACDSTDSPPAPTGLITLTSPKGGESFKVGAVMHVTWSVNEADPLAPDAVDVLMSADSGKTWGYIKTGGSIPKASLMWGDFPWTVLDSLKVKSGAKVSLAGKQALIRVEQYATTNAKLTSTLAKSITITAP